MYFGFFEKKEDKLNVKCVFSAKVINLEMLKVHSKSFLPPNKHLKIHALHIKSNISTLAHACPVVNEKIVDFSAETFMKF